MPLCVRRLSGAGSEFYTDDPGYSEYGGKCESLSGYRCHPAADFHGRQLVPVYLHGHWDHSECGQECGTNRGRGDGSRDGRRRGGEFGPVGGGMKILKLGRRIIIAGGGTGGHIFPALAIANALRKREPDMDILFVGAKGKMEMEKIPEAGYTIRGIDIAGYNRSSLIKNLALPYKLIKSFLQVKEIFKTFRPQAAIGVGGYSTFPVLRYAQAKGIPTFIHESNSVAGKANRMLGKKATRIFAASDGMENFFPAARLIQTGNPVRKNVVAKQLTRDQGLAFFGLSPDYTTVLVTGGSLGAKSINEAIDAGVSKLVKNQIQLIWQTGKSFSEQAAVHAVETKGVWTSEFISSMEYAYAAADI